MFRLVWLQSACVSICVPWEAEGRKSCVPRTQTGVTHYVCVFSCRAGVWPGAPSWRSAQRTAPGAAMQPVYLYTESHRCDHMPHTLMCSCVCVCVFFSRQGLIGVKACLNWPVSAIGGNMGGCSRMSKLTTVDFSLIRFKFNSSHSYAVSFDLVDQLFILSSVPD